MEVTMVSLRLGRTKRNLAMRINKLTYIQISVNAMSTRLPPPFCFKHNANKEKLLRNHISYYIMKNIRVLI